MFKNLKKRFFEPTLGNTAKIISQMGNDYEVRINPNRLKDNYGSIRVIVGKYRSLPMAIDKVKAELERNGFMALRVVDDDSLVAIFTSSNIFIRNGSFNIEFIQETNKRSYSIRENSSRI